MRERYAYAITEVSARPMVRKGFLGALLLAGFALLLLEHAQNTAAQRVRGGLLDLMEPVLSAVTQPVDSVQRGVASWGDYFNTVEENRRLKIENERLRHWQSAAEALKAENENLQSLVNYRPIEHATFVTAQVVGQAPGAYSQSLMLNAGAVEGIKKLQPVIDSYGLLGRVVDVAEHSSRVLLISDPASRIPVITGDTRQHAILVGTGEDMMRLEHLTADEGDLSVSEPVVTTAEGNLIPGGVAIGQIFRSDASGYVVKPIRPLTQAEYVRVVTH